MSRFLVIWIALAIGCRDQGLSRLDEVRATVCKCKNALCAEEAMKVVPAMKVKPSPRSQKIARDMLDCLAKLHAADRPTTGPDEAPPAPEPPPASLEPPPTTDKPPLPPAKPPLGPATRPTP